MHRSPRVLAPLAFVLTAACCATVVLALLACEPGIVEAVHRGEGGVQRRALIVRATVDPADNALSDSLGWAEGVPGVEVWVHRTGTSAADWTVAETDSTGTVVFEHLLAGQYRVWGERVLDADEAQAAGGVIRAFGDGRTLNVSGETELELLLYADRPGGLVFSEAAFPTPPMAEIGEANGYAQAYLEIYNNSDSTYYLDGMLIGHTWAHVFKDLGTPLTCALTQEVRDDASVLHALEIVQFPGDGTDYPLGPGETRVVAMVAIDHSATWPTSGLDLSDADFEVGAAKFGDNPAVPNMIDVGPHHAYICCGLHQPPYASPNVTFLAQPLDVASLPIVSTNPVLGNPNVGVPREALLDVVAFTTIWPDFDVEYPPCVPMVHRDFNRYEGFFSDSLSDPTWFPRHSLQRRVLRVEEGGRVVLSNTHTSAVDFTWLWITPGTLPAVP